MRAEEWLRFVPRFLIVPVSHTAIGIASTPRVEIKGSSVVDVWRVVERICVIADYQ